jgi:hypothetical protein
LGSERDVEVLQLVGGREMYASLASAAPPSAPPVACHLRAAPVMRPGVPGRLSSLLSDIHGALDELVEHGKL